jgi:hypothetical protein
MDLDRLTERLGELGLRLLGAFSPTAEDGVPPLPNGRAARSVCLVGNVGSAFWRHVEASPEGAGPDPVDRWTGRVVGTLAAELGAGAVYPFDGPPWHPFQRWARRADPSLAVSPLGILIHPQWGLWHACRAALLLAEPTPTRADAPRPSPCDACPDRPCLHACPVAAFTVDGYDAGACARHLDGAAGGTCRGRGCLARLACPVGRAQRYSIGLHAYLLDAFVAARRPGGSRAEDAVAT